MPMRLMRPTSTRWWWSPPTTPPARMTLTQVMQTFAKKTYYKAHYHGHRRGRGRHGRPLLPAAPGRRRAECHPDQDDDGVTSKTQVQVAPVPKYGRPMDLGFWRNKAAIMMHQPPMSSTNTCASPPPTPTGTVRWQDRNRRVRPCGAGKTGWRECRSCVRRNGHSAERE